MTSLQLPKEEGAPLKQEDLLKDIAGNLPKDQPAGEAKKAPAPAPKEPAKESSASEVEPSSAIESSSDPAPSDSARDTSDSGSLSSASVALGPASKEKAKSKLEDIKEENADADSAKAEVEKLPAADKATGAAHDAVAAAKEEPKVDSSGPQAPSFKALDTAFSMPQKKRTGEASGFWTKSLRTVSFPGHWLFHRTVGYDSVDPIKIMSQFLPTFYLIPKESQPDVEPFVKKHVIVLSNGRKIVALKDMKHCRDSRSWFKRQKADVLKDLVLMRYTRGVILELDELSDKQFGRFLKRVWDSSVLQAEEEIAFQKRIRGQK